MCRCVFRQVCRRTTKNYLEENDSKWNKRKEKKQEEIHRIERLEQARNKGILAKQRKLRNEQEKIINKLPQETKIEIDMEQAKQEKLELKRAKESLWKLRNTENKMEQTQEILEIKKLEKKHEIMEQVLEKCKKELMEQEENIRKQTNNIINPKQQESYNLQNYNHPSLPPFL